MCQSPVVQLGPIKNYFEVTQWFREGNSKAGPNLDRTETVIYIRPDSFETNVSHIWIVCDLYTEYRLVWDLEGVWKSEGGREGGGLNLGTDQPENSLIKPIRERIEHINLREQWMNQSES